VNHSSGRVTAGSCDSKSSQSLGYYFVRYMTTTSLSQSLYCQKSRDSSVGIAAGYRLDGRGPIPDKGNIFLFSIKSRQVLGPTQPAFQWVPRIKRPGREADHSPPSSSGFKKGGAIPPLPPYTFMAWCLIEHKDKKYMVE
jgi:hypothetical protein